MPVGRKVAELLDTDLIHGVLLDELNEVPGVHGLVLDQLLGELVQQDPVGDPPSDILAIADEEGPPSLVVVGSRGLGAVKRLVLGSVSTAVLRAARGPVLIVKAPP